MFRFQLYQMTKLKCSQEFSPAKPLMSHRISQARYCNEFQLWNHACGSIHSTVVDLGNSGYTNQGKHWKPVRNGRCLTNFYVTVFGQWNSHIYLSYPYENHNNYDKSSQLVIAFIYFDRSLQINNRHMSYPCRATINSQQTGRYRNLPGIVRMNMNIAATSPGCTQNTVPCMIKRGIFPPPGLDNYHASSGTIIVNHATLVVFINLNHLHISVNLRGQYPSHFLKKAIHSWIMVFLWKMSDGTIASPPTPHPILPLFRTVAVLVQLTIYGPKLGICEASLHLEMV